MENSMMTVKEMREFLQEAGRAGSLPGLDRIRHLMHTLDDIQDQLAIIHIAGTNGKGSVGAYLEYIFREAGFTVGRFCSPAVFSEYDMWRYEGENITEEAFVDVMSQVKCACDIVLSEGGTLPTLFELQTAAAFVWFSRIHPDLVILETGMGGAEDATNLIRYPLCSVLTSISYDHMQFLGNTLSEIAETKSGIIKRGRPVFSAWQKPEVEKVIRRVSQDACAPILMVKKARTRLIRQKPGELQFFYRDILITTQLAGRYQMQNASLAVKTSYYMIPLLERHRKALRQGADARMLLRSWNFGSIREEEKNLTQRIIVESDPNWQFVRVIDVDTCHKMSIMIRIVAGIAKTTWPGRFELLHRKFPYFVIDGAHNEAAARELARTVEGCFPEEKLIYIVGVLSDKAYERMLEIMSPYAERIICVTPDNPRALPAEKLAEQARKYYEEVCCCDSVREAVALAEASNCSVLAFGSLSYLGELRICHREWMREASVAVS